MPEQQHASDSRIQKNRGFSQNFSARDPAGVEIFQIQPGSINTNPSCYQRKLREQVRTKRAIFNSNPLAVTA